MVSRSIIAEAETEFVLLENIFEKRWDLPLKSVCKKEKNMISFTHQQNIICSQTKLDAIGHEQTIICWQLFAGHLVGSHPKKRKKHLQQMTRIIIHPQEKIIF